MDLWAKATVNEGDLLPVERVLIEVPWMGMGTGIRSKTDLFGTLQLLGHQLALQIPIIVRLPK